MKSAILPWLLLPLCCAARHYMSFQNGEHHIYYEEFGSGPPLYILTGGPGAPPDYPGYLIIDSLKTHYTCVLLHQRGAGRSKFMPVNADNFSMAQYTQDIELLRRQRGDKRATLQGSFARYDFVGLPGNFLSVKSGSSSIVSVAFANPLTDIIKNFLVCFDPVHLPVRSCYQTVKRYVHK